MIYKKLTEKMDFFIDDSRKTITIEQKWNYDFKIGYNFTTYPKDPCVSPWTGSEQRIFHTTASNIIEESWGEFFYLKSKGMNTFGIKNFFTDWDVNFTIKRVYHDEHWKVVVKKIPEGDLRWDSHVNWSDSLIALTSNDVNPSSIDIHGEKHYQTAALHEFGHTIGNNSTDGWGTHFKGFASNPHMFRGDEYKSENIFYEDKQSIMNVGDEIRNRHLWYIIWQLDTMIPGVKFAL